ncbi:MAG TPA: EamA family transporter [Micromonosporaceae bacterium]
MERLLAAVPPTALVLSGVVSVQLGGAIAKQLFALTSPIGVVTLRLVFAGLVLVALWRPRVRLDARAVGVVLAFGTVLGVMNTSIYLAFARIPLGVAVTIEFLGPLLVAIAGSRRWLDALWAALAGAGVLLLTEGAEGAVDWLGVAFAGLAGACWAGYILLGARLGRHTPGGTGLALATVFAALAIAPFGIAESGTDLLSPRLLVLSAGVAVLSSVVPYSLEIEALRRMPARVFGVLMSLDPAVAALAGLVILGELLSPSQWIAIGCVVAASIGATRGTRNQPRDL